MVNKILTLREIHSALGMMITVAEEGIRKDDNASKEMATILAEGLADALIQAAGGSHGATAHDGDETLGITVAFQAEPNIGRFFDPPPPKRANPWPYTEFDTDVTMKDWLGRD